MMLTPAYKLTLGDQIVDTTDEPRASTVVELAVTLDMDTPADSFTLVLGRVGSLMPERDDEAIVELGWAGDGGLVQVMAGTVRTVETGLVNTRVVGHSAAEALLHAFAEETFEAKTAGQMVRELAGRAGVDVARAEDGILFPAYVVDGRRSLYHHLRDLADLAGCDLYLDASGMLVFERLSGDRTAHVFTYAQHLVELEELATPPRAAAVEAWGESAGAGQGEGSWAWLIKDFDGYKGSAGSGEPVLLLERPALRTTAAATTAAQAAHTALARRTVRGRLLASGRPQVRLGDSIRLRDVPAGSPEGVFQVRSVSHHLDKRHGFTTTVGFRNID